MMATNMMTMLEIPICISLLINRVYVSTTYAHTFNNAILHDKKVDEIIRIHHYRDAMYLFAFPSS